MRLSVRLKLMASFLAVSALIVVIGIFAVAQISSMNGDIDVVGQHRLPAVQTVNKIQTQIGTYRRRQMIHLLSPVKDKAASAQEIADTKATIDGLFTDYTPYSWGSEDQALYKEAVQAWTDYQTQTTTLTTLSDAGKTSQGFALLTTGAADASFSTLGDTVAAWDKLVRDSAASVDASAATTASFAGAAIVGLMLVSSLLALAAGFLFSRSISRRLHLVQTKTSEMRDAVTSFSGCLSALSRNDLTAVYETRIDPLPNLGSDEIAQTADSGNDLLVSLGEMAEAYELARQNLTSTVGDVRTAAESVARTAAEVNAASTQSGAAANQVAYTINQVASGAGDQARAASSTSVAVQDLSAIIEQVGAGAAETATKVDVSSRALDDMASAINSASAASGQVQEVADMAANAAHQGADSVTQAIAGMARIRGTVIEASGRVTELGAKSDQIGAIVETIDDIAEQTNLLALNAAIEAARAGEQGKGFAVVADEVRKLAERASRATKEIGALIAEVQQGTEQAVQAMAAGTTEVEQGAHLADQAGASLGEIADAVSATKSAVLDITAAVDAMARASAGVVSASDAIATIAGQTNVAAGRMTAAAMTVSSSVDSIAAVAEENSAAAEEVSAATEQMSGQAEEVVASALSLATMARQLDELVARFTLDGSFAPVQVWNGSTRAARGSRAA